MLTPSILALLALAQTPANFPRALPNATSVNSNFSVGVKPKGSYSINTGFVPFRMTFLCTVDQIGPNNGCYSTAQINLNAVELGSYWYRGDQPLGSALPYVKQAETQISGFKITPSADISVSEIYIDTQTYNLSGQTVSLYVHANLRHAPNSMWEQFEVDVVGELVWSAKSTTSSQIYTTDIACTGSTERCTQNITFPSALNSVSGVSIGKLQITNPTGIHTSGISARVAATKSNASADCALYGGNGVSCTQRLVILSGRTTEAIAFTSQRFSHTSGPFPSPYNTTISQSQATTSKHKEMACGLREFISQTQSLQVGAFGGIQVGAEPSDCGFNGPDRFFPAGGWDYTVPQYHFLRVMPPGATTPLPFKSEFVLDGSSLLWP